jgi:hypothetical protein
MFVNVEQLKALDYKTRRFLAAQAKREIKAVRANIEAARCEMYRLVQADQLTRLEVRLWALTQRAGK